MATSLPPPTRFLQGIQSFQAISSSCQLCDYLLSDIIRWINSSAPAWRRPGCIATTRLTRASISRFVININWGETRRAPPLGCRRESRRIKTNGAPAKQSQEPTHLVACSLEFSSPVKWNKAQQSQLSLFIPLPSPRGFKWSMNNGFISLGP